MPFHSLTSLSSSMAVALRFCEEPPPFKVAKAASNLGEDIRLIHNPNANPFPLLLDLF